MNTELPSGSERFLRNHLRPAPARRCLVSAASVAAGMVLALAGCATAASTPTPGPAAPPPAIQSAPPPVTVPEAAKNLEVLILREGDVIRVAFPGVPTMDTTLPIRRDGKITLPLVGEVEAVGMSPNALQQKLVALYAPQLVNKEVTVAVVSSSYSVFVSGAVLRPGRINAERPLTLLEAVMEAGGIDFAKANASAVVVIRQSEGNRRYDFNLKAILEGKSTETFYLKPSDVVIVPEKFNWF